MAPRSNGQFRILLVDDDPSVLDTYRRLFVRCGYRPETAADPLRVLAEADRHATADLLLLDFKMPGMDGLSLLAELRRRECRARCILISAYLNEDVRQQARNLGVDRILEKPVDVCALKQALRELLPASAQPRVKAAG